MSIVTPKTGFVRPTSRRPHPWVRTWQQAMKDAVRDPAELCRLLDLPAGTAARAAAAGRDFPLFAPREFIARMQQGDPADPLLRQVLPLEDEDRPAAGYTADPLEEQSAALGPGVLHKYAGRVLLVATGACAVHCRYCFRRYFPYGEVPRLPADWRATIGRIADDESIHEVLLSGGDPLTLSDARLAELADALAEVPHLKRLRVHSRLPVVIPQRVNDALLDWFARGRLTPVMVIHANHAAELDAVVAAAVDRLRDARVTVLNQAVLLRGVNDSVAALADLSERLLELGVVPYYLHQLDRVAGAAHFEVPIAEGRRLIEALRARLPGYAVPRYVCEVPGAASKLPLA